MNEAARVPGAVPALDGVRALAIASVMVHHFVFLDPSRPRWLLRGGFLGVDVFLVLSAFLISRSIRSEVSRTGSFDVRAYALRRARRILPALVLMFVVHATIGAAIGDPIREEIRQIVLSFSFVSNWQLSFGHHAPLDLVHLWSLAVEVQFYVLMAILGAMFARHRAALERRFSPTVALVVVLGFVGIVAVGRIWMWNDGFDTEAMFQRTDLRLDTLMVGIVVGILAGSGWRFLRGTTIVTGMGFVLLITLMCTLETRSEAINYWGYPAVALASGALIAGVCMPGTLQRVFEMPGLVWLGRISYSLYLWHLPIFVWLKRADLGLSFPALAVLASTVSILVAAISYYGVERRWIVVRPTIRIHEQRDTSRPG